MICINVENAVGSHGFTRHEVHHLPPGGWCFSIRPAFEHQQCRSRSDKTDQRFAAMICFASALINSRCISTDHNACSGKADFFDSDIPQLIVLA